MASLYITEFVRQARDGNGHLLPVGECPPIAQQKVTYTTSTASAAFNSATTFIRVKADADAHLAFAASPTADATDMQIEADVAEYFGVNRDDVATGLKVAAYDGSS